MTAKLIPVLKMMDKLIPALNASTEEEFVRQAQVAQTLGTHWVQVDVSDGVLGVPKSFAEPTVVVRELQGKNVDVHLMVQDVRRALGRWLPLRPTRLTVHREALADPKAVYDQLTASHIEFGLALGPQTPVEAVLPFMANVDLLLFVAVPPGRSGQTLDPHTCARVRRARSAHPRVSIGVDGGIRAEHLQPLRDAGATVLFVSSAIFTASDPRVVYADLKHQLEA